MPRLRDLDASRATRITVAGRAARARPAKDGCRCGACCRRTLAIARPAPTHHGDPPADHHAHGDDVQAGAVGDGRIPTAGRSCWRSNQSPISRAGRGCANSTACRSKRRAPCGCVRSTACCRQSRLEFRRRRLPRPPPSTGDGCAASAPASTSSRPILALLRENSGVPTAAQIAERAGYSVRSLFERFPDLLALQPRRGRLRLRPGQRPGGHPQHRRRSRDAHSHPSRDARRGPARNGCRCGARSRAICTIPRS